MGAEISRVVAQPIADAWLSFNKYCLDSCTNNCESPCCKCGIETHAHETTPEAHEIEPSPQPDKVSP